MYRGDCDPAGFDDLEEIAKARWDEESLALLNHELRNALASIVSALQVLRMQGYVNPVAEQAGRTIERQADHLAALADQLAEAAGMPKERNHKPAAKRPAARDAVAEVAPRRILVVDDNRDAADSTGLLLVLWGHQVRVVYDGPSAVAAATEYRPDVCLIDIGMPGMDGFQVAERLRQDPALADMRLIALTGFDREAGEQSTDPRFDAYLLKPVELAALQEVLAEQQVGRGKAGA
jgi:CheY-like chemotaxis protein